MRAGNVIIQYAIILAVQGLAIPTPDFSARLRSLVVIALHMVKSFL